MNKINLKNLWFGAFFVFLFDQLTKIIAKNYFPFDTEFKINNYLSIHVIHNENTLMASTDFFFSSDYTENLFLFKLFYISACLLIFALIYWTLELKELHKNTLIHDFLRTGLFLIIGSNFGNTFDRIAGNAVVDFIRVNNFFDGQPIMNFADIILYFGELSIVFAFIIYFYYYFFDKQKIQQV